jgi:hypothetical protein
MQPVPFGKKIRREEAMGSYLYYLQLPIGPVSIPAIRFPRAGCVLGFMISSVAGGAAMFVAFRNARHRTGVWWIFLAVFAIALLITIVAVYHYPYATPRPGSDYDVALRNLFLKGLGYCACLGPAALIAALATFLAPRKT